MFYENLHIYSVGEITEEIKDILESNFYEVFIRGEVSNFRPSSSGHYYFVLKDERAQIRCVIFRSSIHKGVREIKDGDEVVVFGGISLYPPRGEYQIVVNRVFFSDKKGSLYIEFEKLKEKLEKEGLFDKKFKKNIPSFPKKIGVVTSKTGAAILDIIKTLKRRNPLVEVILYPVKVQGEGAAMEIAEGIRYFNRKKDVDVIIVGRGGGSIEDLWPFNEEIVAREIFKSSIPIISAVGHERDYTISDFVADIRAETPTAAARMVALPLSDYLFKILNNRKKLIESILNILEDRRKSVQILRGRRGFFQIERQIFSFYQRLDSIFYRMEKGIFNGLNFNREKINIHISKLEKNSPLRKIPERKEIFKALKKRIVVGYQNYLLKERERINFLKDKIYSLSPKQTLLRGYSITCDVKGNVLKSVLPIKSGDDIITHLSDGEIKSRVFERRRGDGKDKKG